MRQIAIDPFNRVEGDLAVEARLAGGMVSEASVKGKMFRGFEKILAGQRPMDALAICCRICGICSASHSTAGSEALRNALGNDMPENARLVRNIVLGTETLMSHLTHLYFLFLPDFINTRYAAHPFWGELKRRFEPFVGVSYRKALRARRSPLELMGLFAGKWPNTLALHPGGVTSVLDMSHLTRGLGILREFRDFIEASFLGGGVEEWLALSSVADLEGWMERPSHQDADLGLALGCLSEFGVAGLGAGCGSFLSYGAYEEQDGGRWLPAGVLEAGEVSRLNTGLVTEETARTYLNGGFTPRHPLEGTTDPEPDKPGAYSWTKAPRYDGRPFEVGPIARMLIAGDPLICDFVARRGMGVMARELARLHEMIRLLAKLEEWMSSIDPGRPFYQRPRGFYASSGTGVIEAARGSLGHWVVINEARVTSYQVITPTAWNGSPRDGGGIAGPIEQALEGTPVEDPDNPVELAHVVRSFDPCLACSVHTIRPAR